MRRQFSLPAEDMEWLESLALDYELIAENGIPRVVIYGVPTPPGYNASRVDVNIRVETGYPDAALDMVYFFPALSLSDGRQIGAVSPDTFDGKNWQRWSRHRTPANPWRPGLDSLSTHFGLIQNWLEREVVSV